MARPRRKEREMLELIQAAIYAGVNVVIVLLLLIPVLVMAAVSVPYWLRQHRTIKAAVLCGNFVS